MNTIFEAQKRCLLKIVIEDDIKGVLEMAESYPKKTEWLSIVCSTHSTGFDEKNAERFGVSPLFLNGFVFGAVKCVEYFSILLTRKCLATDEFKNNVLHLMVLGLKHGLTSLPTCITIYRTILCECFDGKQISGLHYDTNLNHGLRPYEFAILEGQYQFGIFLMRFSSLVVAYKVDGFYEEYVFDISEYDLAHENSRFAASPPYILTRVMGANLNALAEAEVFRSCNVLNAWSNNLFDRNKNYAFTVFAFSVFVLIEFLSLCSREMIIWSRSLCGDFVGDAFMDSQTTARRVMWGILLTFCVSTLALRTVVIVVCAHKERLLGVPANKWKLLMTLVDYMICDVCILILAMLYGLSKGCSHFLCESFGAEATIVANMVFAICTTLFLFLKALKHAQVIQSVGLFIVTLNKSFASFSRFMLAYVVAIFIFANLFQATRFVLPTQSSPVYNKTLADDWEDYMKAVYGTFRVSINIVDVPHDGVAASDGILHIIFVFIVPYLLLNFVVGLLAKRTNTIMDHSEEEMQQIKIVVGITFEIVGYILRRLCRCGRISVMKERNVTTVTVRCTLSPNSRLLTAKCAL